MRAAACALALAAVTLPAGGDNPSRYRLPEGLIVPASYDAALTCLESMRQGERPAWASEGVGGVPPYFLAEITPLEPPLLDDDGPRSGTPCPPPEIDLEELLSLEVGPDGLSIDDVDKTLTFLNEVGDDDKDGFVDTYRAEANPTGYVVLHFRSSRHNVRITLGQQYDAPENQPRLQQDPPPLQTDNSPGPPAEGELTVVPEPASCLLLLSGAAAILWTRRRR